MGDRTTGVVPVVVQVARGFFHKALSLQDSSVMMSLLVQCRVGRLGGEHFRRCSFGYCWKSRGILYFRDCQLYERAS